MQWPRRPIGSRLTRCAPASGRLRRVAWGPYYVLSKRVGEPKAEIWPIGLREPLPRIGIPIRADVDDIAVELQPLLDRVYDEGRYADLIDYAQSPPAPALPGDEARWVAEQVERWLAARSA